MNTTLEGPPNWRPIPTGKPALLHEIAEILAMQDAGFLTGFYIQLTEELPPPRPRLRLVKPDEQRPA